MTDPSVDPFLAQGREVFNGTCTGCHTAASHTGTIFTNRWVGQPLAELFGYITSTMPKTEPGSLSEDEYVWVTAYLLRLNGMPVGDSALSGDPALLGRIRIDTVKVQPKGAGASGAGVKRKLSHLRPALQH